MNEMAKEIPPPNSEINFELSCKDTLRYGHVRKMARHCDRLRDVRARFSNELLPRAGRQSPLLTGDWESEQQARPVT
jgi:hypothetical protein